ncbi:MAG: hypothetical protein ACEQR8_11070 [Cypionkella sp.]
MTAPCSKCGGAMEEGFVVDQGHGTVAVSTWQGGEPRRSFWTGVKQDKAAQRAIASFRCRRCGYLESYAN